LLAHTIARAHDCSPKKKAACTGLWTHMAFEKKAPKEDDLKKLEVVGSVCKKIKIRFSGVKSKKRMSSQIGFEFWLS
jgi:hypothetical protein